MGTEREHRLQPYLGTASRDTADAVPGQQPGVGKTTLVEQQYGRPQHPAAFGMQMQSYLRSMEPSFGADFSGVQIHADSARAGSADAFTEGNDIHFAPGKWAPESSSGRWLLAHELAHVVQQRGGNAQHAPGLAHEADADHAANAAVSGGRANVTVGARHGARQNYEAYEHRALGDSGGGDKRTITTNTGVVLTFGQVVALSGDFYRSPEALMNAPKGELQNILKIMDREREQAHICNAAPFGLNTLEGKQLADNNNDYDLVTTGKDSREGLSTENQSLPDEANTCSTDRETLPKVTQGEHIEDNGLTSLLVTAMDKFTDLAQNNNSHFGPMNIEQNYRKQHNEAIRLAKEVYALRHGANAKVSAPTQATDPNMTPDDTKRAEAERKESFAYLSEGFAAHFLTDAFASGHLISGDVGRVVGGAFMRAKEKVITTAIQSCVNGTIMLLSPDPSMAGTIAELVMSAVMTKADSLALKVVHDYFNKNGLWVMNKQKSWLTTGDNNLHASPEAQRYGSLAVQASRQAIDKVLQQGFVSDEDRDKALDYIPLAAKFDNGEYVPIATFANDPTVYQKVLERTVLSDKPGENELWKLITSYVVPILKGTGKKLIRDLQEMTPEERKRAIKAQLGKWFDAAKQGAKQKVKGLVKDGRDAVDAGVGKAKATAKTVGDAVGHPIDATERVLEQGTRELTPTMPR